MEDPAALYNGYSSKDELVIRLVLKEGPYWVRQQDAGFDVEEGRSSSVLVLACMVRDLPPSLLWCPAAVETFLPTECCIESFDWTAALTMLLD
jgi:hypothetical protein